METDTETSAARPSKLFIGGRQVTGSLGRKLVAAKDRYISFLEQVEVVLIVCLAQSLCDQACRKWTPDLAAQLFDIAADITKFCLDSGVDRLAMSELRRSLILMRFGSLAIRCEGLNKPQSKLKVVRDRLFCADTPLTLPADRPPVDIGSEHRQSQHAAN